MIYTFYSYKGGVGRSMALANVATWFFERGLRVALLDWDLEAPGLESFFFENEEEREQIRSTVGVIDLLVGYKRKFANLELPPAKDDGARRPHVVADALGKVLTPLAHAFYPVRKAEAGGSISLLPAGWRSGDRFGSYAEAVQRFDWAEFYARYEGEGFFEWMRRELTNPALADVVIIDSRTGVTEMGGVCTRQLPDVVVCLCAPNAQNLDGVARLAASFNHAEVVARRGRRVETVMVPSRVDHDNTELKTTLRSWFDERFSANTPEKFKTLKSDFWALRIPYLSSYAYREHLAVGDPNADPDLVHAYEQVAVHLALLAPNDSALSRAVQPDIERLFGRLLPEVFIAYGSEDREFAARLHADATRAGVPLWPLLHETGAGADWAAKLQAQLEQSKLALLVITQKGLGSGWVKATWRAARARGLQVFPVRSGTVEGTAELPAWMELDGSSAPESLWPQLTNALKATLRPDRVPNMAPAPPPSVVVRGAELAAISAVLAPTAESGKTPSVQPPAVVLSGRPGSGKSVLAATFCGAERTIDRFYDGIVWVTFGKTPDLLEVLRKVLSAFSVQDGAVRDESEAWAAVEHKLANKRCLLVLDDVWDDSHIARFLSAGPACAFIVTTRSRGLSIGLAARTIAVGELDPQERRDILTRDLELADADREQVQDWAAGLVGGSSLGLTILNQALRRRVAQGDAPASAMQALKASVERGGATALDQAGAIDANQSIQASVERTLEKLSSDQLRRLAVIASKPPGPIRIEQLAREWRMAAGEADAEVRRLADLSLLDLGERASVQMHPLIRLSVLARGSSTVETPAPQSHTLRAWVTAAAIVTAVLLMVFALKPATPGPVAAVDAGPLTSVDAGASDAGPALPEDVQTLVRRFRESGNELLASGKADNAISAYDSAILLAPDDASLLVARGDAHRKSAATADEKRSADELKAAVADYDRALVLDPKLGDALVKRAALKAAQKDVDGALLDLQKAIGDDPKNVEAQLALGGVLAGKSDANGAIAAFTAAIAAAPSRVDAYFLRGTLYADTNQRDRAIQDLKRVVSFPQADPTTLQAADARLKKLNVAVDAAERPTAVKQYVYIQYSRAADAKAVQNLRSGIAKRFAVQASDLVQSASTSGDVRYAFPEDQRSAEQIAWLVQTNLASQGYVLHISVIKLSQKSFPNARPGNIEVWLPPLSDTAAPVATVRPPTESAEVSSACRQNAEVTFAGKSRTNSDEALEICRSLIYIITPLAAEGLSRDYEIPFVSEESLVKCRCREQTPTQRAPSPKK
ncbi:MAG TPA: NB-ARC domain-containing protein [Polyangiaceae bacterium]|nr:NB-ARC domain-containing protein [Polyangiaceae bacterium]